MDLRNEASLGVMRPCVASDRHDMLGIINAAAGAYRGVIPPDLWREPYMPADELAFEIVNGVAFVGCEVAGALVGVMGVQHRANVDLIRHAYVLPAWQAAGRLWIENAAGGADPRRLFASPCRALKPRRVGQKEA